MKRFLIYIMVCVAAMPLFSCEDLTPEFYQNTPVIEDVKFQFAFIEHDRIELRTTLSLDKNYGYEILADVGKFKENYFTVSKNLDDTYFCAFDIYLNDFDQVDYAKGKLVFNNLNIVIRSRDGIGVELATYSTNVLSLTLKPSITMTKVTRDGRYYRDDTQNPLSTDYTGYFTVTGAIFFRELYTYRIGSSWNNPGKGFTIYDYKENTESHYQTAIGHGYNFSSTLYNQFRGMLCDGKTEIVADKTIRLSGTGDGWVTVDLVSSVTVPSTRSGAGSGECIAVPIEQKSGDTPKVNYVYTIEPTVITLNPTK